MSGRSASTGASPPLMPASSSSTSTHQLLIDRTLAVVVSPHRFTTALTSEASIVPGASYRRITPTACPGRVLGAASQVRSCFVQLSQPVLQLRVAPPPPNQYVPFVAAYGSPLRLGTDRRVIGTESAH